MDVPLRSYRGSEHIESVSIAGRRSLRREPVALIQDIDCHSNGKLAVLWRAPLTRALLGESEGHISGAYPFGTSRSGGFQCCLWGVYVTCSVARHQVLRCFKCIPQDPLESVDLMRECILVTRLLYEYISSCKLLSGEICGVDL